jgi:hypothetical protein
MDQQEYIYHGECHHIFTDDIRGNDCIKRYFTVYDYLKNKELIIAVCNEALRLEVREFNLNRDWYYNSYLRISEKIISEYIPIKDIRNKNLNIFNPSFSIKVCNRPFLTTDVYLFDAIESIIINRSKGPCGMFYFNMRQRVYDQLLSVVNRTMKLKSISKKHKDQMSVVANQLIKGSYCRQLSEETITKLFITFFEVQTKLIYKNGTS